MECNTFAVKLTRHLKDEDPDLVADWGLLSKEKKRDVYRDNHNVLGTDLYMVIREATEDIRTDRLIRKFTASGHMKDLEDLTEQYKNKPLQLKTSSSQRTS